MGVPGTITPVNHPIRPVEVFRHAVALESALAVSDAGVMDPDPDVAQQEAERVMAETARHETQPRFLRVWADLLPKAGKNARLKAEAARKSKEARLRRDVASAIGRLRDAVNPFLAGVTVWERQVGLADASPDARQALITLGLAVADIGGRFPARGRGLLTNGARHLWVGMSAGERDAVRESASEARRLWGWADDRRGRPPRYDGPVPTLRDGRVIDRHWCTRREDVRDSIEPPAGLKDACVAEIELPNGRSFKVRWGDVKEIRATRPSVCRAADPKLPEKLRPAGELLACLERRFRDWGLLSPNLSIHWVGHQNRPDTWCLCGDTGRTHKPLAASSSLEGLGSSGGAHKRAPGRPPDPEKPEITKFVIDLRKQRTPWKLIPDRVWKQFGRKYAIETLQKHARSG